MTTELHHQPVAVGNKKDVIIRNVCLDELNHRVHTVQGSYMHPIISPTETDTPLVNNKNNQYAGAFHRTSIGTLMGAVVWNPNKNKIHMLLAPKNDIVISSLLVDHAILHFKNKDLPISSNDFVKESNYGPTEIQKNYINKTLIGREVGDTLEESHYKELIRTPIDEEILLLIKEKSSLKKIKLYVDIEYQPILAQSTYEKKPELHIYLSSTSAKGVCILKPRKKHLTSNGTYLMKKQILIFTPIVKEVKADCIFNIDVYARHRNKKDEWCLNQSGYGNTLVCSLFTQESQTISLKVVNSGENANKGFISISIDPTQTICPFINDAISSRDVSKELHKNELVINNYIQSNRNFYNKYPASASSVRNVTVYTYQSRLGYVPGSMFDVFNVTKAREEVYLQYLDIALRRYYGVYDSKSNMNELWCGSCSHIDKTMREKVVMRMLAVYVTACPYITDEVDHNNRRNRGKWNSGNIELIESFDNMFPRDAGDCEDFSRAILRLVCELKFHSNFVSKAMNFVLQVLDKFIFCSVLCGVSNAALTDVPKRGSTYKGKLNGHEGVFAIPKFTFFKALERHNKNHIILQHQSYEELQKGSNDIVYILEGTGMLIPEPSKDTTHESVVEQIVNKSCEILKMDSPFKLARTYFHYDPNGGDNFYKMMITCLTPEFFLMGLPYVEFLLYYKNNKSSYGTRGVWFNELLSIRKHKDIALVPSPQLSSDVIYSTSYVTKDQYPLVKLRYPKIKQENLNIVKELTMIIPVNTSSSNPKLPKDISQTYYLNFDDFTSNTIKDIQRLCKLTGLKSRTRAELINLNQNSHVVGVYAINLYN